MVFPLYIQGFELAILDLQSTTKAIPQTLQGAAMTRNDDEQADPKAIAEVLRGYLVRCGNPSLRLELAERLAEEGMTDGQAVVICEAMDGCGKAAGETAAMIGHVLKTAAGWQAYLADVEFAAARRSRRRPMVNMPGAVEREQVRRSLQSYVVERVTVDGATPEDVAEAIDVSLEAIQSMLREVPS